MNVMSDFPRDLKNVRRPLPEVTLQPPGGGEPLRVRARGRRSPVLVVRHPQGCAGCDAYLAELAGSRDEISEWDGRVVVVIPDGASVPDPPERAADQPFPVGVDVEGRLAAALSVEVPALAIADQWGELHLIEAAGSGHRFPPVEEVIEWVRYLAIHCPECEGEVL